MELSLEIRGYLADLIAKEGLGGIKIIGMRVGILPERIQKLISNVPFMMPAEMITLAFHQDPYEGLSPNERAAAYIVNTGNQYLLIETVLDVAKRKKQLGGERYSKIFAKLNSIMERTMQCRINKEGDIIPIFGPSLEIIEKQTYIEKKLEEFEFAKTLANYKSAIKTYKTDYKGSISLLRSTFESLVDEIIESKEEPLKGSRKDKLAQLTNRGIFKKIEKDNEVEHSYRIFSLLSHYGSHSALVTEEEANFLFTSTLAFIWFLINRYEKYGGN